MNYVEALWQRESLLEDCHQDIDADRDPDLGFDGRSRRSRRSRWTAWCTRRGGPAPNDAMWAQWREKLSTEAER